MALIFLGVLIVFTVSSFQFYQVKSPWLRCQWWVAQFTRPLFTGLLGLR